MKSFTTLVSAEELKPLVDGGTAAVFDCTFDLGAPTSGQAAYLAGHIPGAFYLDLDKDLSAAPNGRNGRHPLPDVESFSARLRECGLRVGQQVVAYDRSGGPYAARLWWLLRWLGHDAVAVLDGGLDAWTSVGGILESGDPVAPPPGDFDPKVRPGLTVGADDLTSALGSARYIVVDARSPERFRGDPNPLDPVSGHIPGARNRFFMTNLDGKGRWKSAEVLRGEISALIGPDPAGAIVQQCGSGVTACHNALAFTHAGMGEYLLYPGSWSEWISDSDRPIATGPA